MKSVHELAAAIVSATAGAGRGSRRLPVPMVPAREDESEPSKYSSCECSFLTEKDLHGKKEAPQPPPSFAERYVFEKRLSLLGGSSVVSKQEQEQQEEQKQQADEAAAPEAPATPGVEFQFDLNVPLPEVAEEMEWSGYVPS
jgi:hypothetical protein